MPSRASLTRRRARREALLLSILTLLTVAAGILGLWVQSSQAIRRNYRHHLIDLALAASSVVDPELQKSIRHPEQLNGPLYTEAVTPLRRMRDAVPEIRYVYTVVRDGSDVRFILDAAPPQAKSANGLGEQAGVWELYRDTGPAMRAAVGDEATEGRPSATDDPTTDQWGTFMSGIVPLKDATGRQIGAVGVDVDASRFVDRLVNARNAALLGLAPAGLLIIGLGVGFYRIRLRGLNLAVAAKLTAHRDALTGLANRALFMRELARVTELLQRGEHPPITVLFLDFDRFKLINDTLGHEAGDDLLRQIAARLSLALRAAASVPRDPRRNFIGRIGGDEFLALLPCCSTREQAVATAERLLESLVWPYSLNGNDFNSSASIGIAVSDPSGTTAEDLVRNADVAMYEAKRAGRGLAVMFDEPMRSRLLRFAAIDTELRKALGTAQLRLVYQPIIDLGTGTTASVEALLRWKHPALGEVSPSEFIPVAEESNLILALGEWVQRQACTTLAGWRRTDPLHAPQSVCINISRTELALGSQLLRQVVAVLEDTGLPARCLELEVTEREVMRNPEAARDVLNRLRQMGVKTAMDDFGTGTSSLSVLRGYPFDTVKIDRSFLQDVMQNPDVLAVIHATISLVENLGMNSLAEGIQDGGQVALLQSLGCKYGQGYGLCRPLEADLVLAHLSRGPLCLQRDEEGLTATAPHNG
jgi:diguanylate cyclase (GGDEF)-like protein